LYHLNHSKLNTTAKSHQHAPHPTWITNAITNATSIMILRIQKPITSLDKLWCSVKQQEEVRKRHSTMLKRESNLDNNTRARRRLNYAETLWCTVNANMVTPAHTLMDTINSKRRHISQAISWLNYVYNSTNKARVLMVRDANISTQSTTLRRNSHTLKHWKREPDLLNWETTRSVVKVLELTASGPTLRHLMDAVPLRSQDSQSLSKSTTRITTTLKSMTRTSWREPTLQAQCTDLTLRTSHTNKSNNNNSQWTTITWATTWETIWDTKQTIWWIIINIKTINQIKCITIIINNITTIIQIITADSKPILQKPTSK